MALEAYVVQPGEVLSTIAQRLVGEPIYGKRGSLKRLIEANPQLLDPNSLLPGQTLTIPQSSNSTDSPELNQSSEPPESPEPLESPKELGVIQEDPIEEAHSWTPRFLMWAGGGIGSMSYSQKTDSDSESGDFSNQAKLAYSLGGEMRISDRFDVRLEFQRIMANIEAPAETELNQSSTSIDTLSAEFFTRIYQHQSSTFSVGIGVQELSGPFLADSASGGVDVLTTKLRTGTLGVRYFKESGGSWKYEAALRYHHLLSAETDKHTYEAEGKGIYDLGAGVFRKVSEDLVLGVYGKLQLIDLSYKFSSDSLDREGEQGLTSSSLQFRAGYTF